MLICILHNIIFFGDVPLSAGKHFHVFDKGHESAQAPQTSSNDLAAAVKTMMQQRNPQISITWRRPRTP
jgi:hypothetical protein